MIERPLTLNVFLSVLVLFTPLATKPCLAGSAPLEGEVEETGVMPQKAEPPKPSVAMPVPVLPGSAQTAGSEGGRFGTPEEPLTGKSAADNLTGGAEDSGSSSLTPESASADSRAGILQGSAVKQNTSFGPGGDPDADDQEMMIEWDKWRNRLLWAIQAGMQDEVNNSGTSNFRFDPATGTMVPKFPPGTEAWFYLQVTPDQRIIHIRLVHKSGYPEYDAAVLDSIANLQGSSILRYPRGSKRPIVTQEAGIKTSAAPTRREFFKFGDVERQLIPAQ